MSETTKPQEGDTYTCQACDMQILVTKGCECEDSGPFFSCCGKQMESSKSS